MLRGTILLVLLILTSTSAVLGQCPRNRTCGLGRFHFSDFRVNQDHVLVAKMLIEEPSPVGEYFSGFRRIGIQDEVDVRHAFKDV
jgi:hypothetical protein